MRSAAVLLFVYIGAQVSTLSSAGAEACITPVLPFKIGDYENFYLNGPCKKGDTLVVDIMSSLISAEDFTARFCSYANFIRIVPEELSTRITCALEYKGERDTADVANYGSY